MERASFLPLPLLLPRPACLSILLYSLQPHHEYTRPEERFRAAPDEDVRRYVPGRGVVEGRRSREGLTVHQAATRGISWLLSGVRL